MKKRKAGRTLSRSKSQREALLRTLLVSLTEYKRIETSLAKAKELRPFAERMVTKAKRALEGAEREMAMIRELKKDLPIKTIKELLKFAKQFAKREGGYLRIIKTMHRRSDASERAIVEWVEELKETEADEKVEEEKSSKTKTKKAEVKKEVPAEVKAEKKTSEKEEEKKEEKDKKQSDK